MSKKESAAGGGSGGRARQKYDTEENINSTASLGQDSDREEEQNNKRKSILENIQNARWVNLQAAAAYDGLSYDTNRKLVLSGQIRAISIPDPDDNDRMLRRIVVRKKDLDRYLDQCEKQSGLDDVDNEDLAETKAGDE